MTVKLPENINKVCDICDTPAMSVKINGTAICRDCLQRYIADTYKAHENYIDQPVELYLLEIQPQWLPAYRKIQVMAKENYGTDNFTFKLDHDGEIQFNLDCFITKKNALANGHKRVVDYAIHLRDDLLYKCIADDLFVVFRHTCLDTRFEE